jgi:hypothetical protein
MSLADHDNLFMPEKRESRARHIGTVLFFIPSLVLMLFPSFDLGTLVLSPPPFEIPKSIRAGMPFLLKDSGEALRVTLNGRLLSHIDKPIAAYVGIATDDDQKAMELEVLYPPEKRTLKTIFKPKFHNPSVPYFTSEVKIEVASSGASESTSRTVASVPPLQIPAHRILNTQLFTRRDGSPSISCFQNPQLNKYEPVQPAAMVARPHKHRAFTQMFALTAAGAGEVVYAGDVISSVDKTADKGLVVYHGGGFYTRYFGLKELKVRQGQKVKAGQDIGFTSTNSHKVIPNPEWDVLWGETPVTSPAFLALSSQLCGST